MLWSPYRIVDQKFLVVFRTKSTNCNDLSELLKTMSTISKKVNDINKTKARNNYEIRKSQTQNCNKGNKCFDIDVIGNGGHGSPRSVNLSTDFFRGLFNCGEGTQRLASEYRFKITRCPHIFITYPSWENVSGLLGVALSLQSIGIPELCLHGPKSVVSIPALSEIFKMNIFSATNKFVALRSISINMMDCEEESEYKDGSIHIKSVPLYPMQSNIGCLTGRPSTANESDRTVVGILSEFDKKIDEDIDYYAHLGPVKRKKHSIRENKPKKHRSHSVDSSIPKKKSWEKYAVSFICRSSDTLGKLLIEKCVDLGVPVGPHLQNLKNGQSITLENGTVVRSEDVTLPNLPGGVAIVLECPTEDYLDFLLKEPAFFKHQSGDPVDIATAVVHFTPVSVLNTPKYREWINRFPRTTKHLYINDSNKSFGSVSVQRQQYKLNLVHSDIFPIMADSGMATFPREETEVSNEGHVIVKTDKSDVRESKGDSFVVMEETLEEDMVPLLDETHFKCENNPHIAGETLCKVPIRPLLPYDYSKSLVLKKDVFINEALSIKGVKEELDKLRSTLSVMTLSDKIYPKILFLGTGSSQPSKLRNTSGILVFVDEDTPIILDCGEGTYSQIVQFYGKEKTWDILRKLNVIYVSHLHADHHIGLITLLKRRKEAILEKQASCPEEATPFKPVNLLAPVQLTRWLLTFENEFESISDLYSFIPNSALMDHIFTKDKYEECLKCLHMEKIQTTLVDHCPNAFGVALIHQDGWKLTYSGDTRPCTSLIELGKNSDVLIHEATMDDSLENVAFKKLHSTTSQAIDMGKKMNAKFTILTHFSQRYSHLPLYNDNFTDEVGVAFDNMLVSFNQLPMLSKFTPSLLKIFTAYYKTMEDKREHYEVKQKRRRKSISPEKGP